MNAHELADELENYVWMNPNNNRDYCKEVKDKLRQQANDVGSLNARLKQQADRIAELQGELSRYELRDLEQTNSIKELENQLDKCSHHEAMAHQGGYEIGKASQIKELSDEEKKQITKEYLHRHLLYVVTEEVVDDHKLHDVVVSDFVFAREILNKASEK